MRCCAIVLGMPDQDEEFARLTLDGPRFAGGNLPIDALVELQRYQRLVLAAAKNAWHSVNGDSDLPEDFESKFGLTIVQVIEGSSTSLMKRPETTSYAEYFNMGRDDLERELEAVSTEDAADVALDDESWVAFLSSLGTDISLAAPVEALTEVDVPDTPSSDDLRRQASARLLPLLALDDFRDFGASLESSDELRIPRGKLEPLVVTSAVRERNFVPIHERVVTELGSSDVDDAPVQRHTVEGVIAGRLVMLNAERRNYTVNTLLHGVINGRYKKPELTADIRAVLNSSARAPVVRLSGSLRFIGSRLEKVLEAKSVELLEIDGKPWSRRFVELASLPVGWAGEDSGESVSFTALDAARDLLTYAAKLNQPPAGISPIEDGGILLEWATPARVTSVEISPDASYIVFDLKVEGREATHQSTEDFRAAKRMLKAVFK